MEEHFVIPDNEDLDKEFEDTLKLLKLYDKTAKSKRQTVEISAEKLFHELWALARKHDVSWYYSQGESIKDSRFLFNKFFDRNIERLKENFEIDIEMVSGLKHYKIKRIK